MRGGAASADGDVVRIYNARGACLAGVVLSDALSPGVAKLSCGAWYDPAGAEDGAMCAHGNANMLTHDRGTSKLSQGPVDRHQHGRDRALDWPVAAGARIRDAADRGLGLSDPPTAFSTTRSVTWPLTVRT